MLSEQKCDIQESRAAIVQMFQQFEKEEKKEEAQREQLQALELVCKQIDEKTNHLEIRKKRIYDTLSPIHHSRGLSIGVCLIPTMRFFAHSLWCERVTLQKETERLSVEKALLIEKMKELRFLLDGSLSLGDSSLLAPQ